MLGADPYFGIAFEPLKALWALGDPEKDFKALGLQAVEKKLSKKQVALLANRRLQEELAERVAEAKREQGELEASGLCASPQRRSGRRVNFHFEDGDGGIERDADAPRPDTGSTREKPRTSEGRRFLLGF